jgi:hypothetical protein
VSVKRLGLASIAVAGSVIFADGVMSHGEPTWRTFGLLFAALGVSALSTRFL